jgi:hypothetical protein
MKTALIAAIAAVALAGTGVASAQTTNVDSNAKVNAGKAHVGAKTSTKASVHKRKHRVTTGTGIETRDNNASAKGSIIPGKDRLNSDAFIGAHGGGS